MQMSKVMTSQVVPLNSATLNQEFLQKYWSSVLQTWHQKRAPQKKQNGTLGSSLFL